MVTEGAPNIILGEIYATVSDEVHKRTSIHGLGCFLNAVQLIL